MSSFRYKVLDRLLRRWHLRAHTAPKPKEAPVAQSSCSQFHPTLYQRLGQEVGLRDAVESFYGRVFRDEQLAPYFEHLNEDGRRQLKWHMRAFLAAATGGPQRYSGREISAAHGRFRTVAAELALLRQTNPRKEAVDAFDAVAGHLDDTLVSYGVSDDDRNEVLAAIAPLKPLIVDGRV